MSLRKRLLMSLGMGLLLGPSSMLSAAEPADSTAKAAVVVELFTSEGCSSCPAADRLLSRLVAEQPVEGVEIVGLGEHVDYWNNLGWRDPFSSSAFTLRQQSYAQAFHSASIYTPQMIVDGKDEFVGSDRAKALSAIRDSLGERRAQVSLSLSSATPTVLEVKIDGLPGSKPGKSRVMLAVTEENLHSQVSRGENRGLRLEHSSVVRDLKQIAEIEAGSGGAFTTTAELSLRPEWKREDLKIVVFVQRVVDQRILGASLIRPLDD